MAIKPQTDYWHRRLGGWPESRECYTLGQGRTQSLWTKPCTKLPLSCGRWVLMFSVGINLYLIPTINGDVWAQARFFIRNDKLEAGKAVCSTSIILVLRPEFPRGEFKFPPASSWYFIKRSKLTSLCPGSGHYTKCYSDDMHGWVTCWKATSHSFNYQMRIWLVQTIFPW